MLVYFENKGNKNNYIWYFLPELIHTSAGQKRFTNFLQTVIDLFKSDKKNVNHQLIGKTIRKISFSKGYPGGLSFLGYVSESQTMHSLEEAATL